MSDVQYDDLKLLISDPQSKVTYRRGCFLGKGGFARCYEFENITTGETFAGKVISKTRLMESRYEELIFQEIQIHSSLSHKFIVALHSNFEDESYIFIILELCRKRSLREMHKRRKTLTVPEVRYFMRQIVLACKYMHDNKVIHRDLKLENLFINDDMLIKVGDFSLATRISHESERKTTFCGTPNYIAPEILIKRDYSFEVDIWCLGCIMYTLLVGSPPFEASTLYDTYGKIKKCEYYIPLRLEQSAQLLIQKLLNHDPELRPNANDILMDDFFTSGYIPSRLPSSCLSMKPKYSHRSLLEVLKIKSQHTLQDVMNISNTIPEEVKQVETENEIGAKIVNLTIMPKDFYLKDLFRMVSSVVQCHPDAIYTGHPEDAQDPSAVPFFWIRRWVNYSDKYGLGYQICDNSTGVLFNDATHLVQLQDEENLQYIEHNKEEQYFDMKNFPPEMSKKITLLKLFNDYIAGNLVKKGEGAKQRDQMVHVPHLRVWFRTKSAMIFHLTNGTFQADFFKDHSKVILCPVMGAVSLIDEHHNMTVYTLQLIEKFGCSPSLASKLKYVKNMVQKVYKDLLLNDKEVEHGAVVKGKNYFSPSTKNAQ